MFGIAKFATAILYKSVLVTATFMILFLGNANAFWRLECDGSVGLARMDPLMNYGTAGDHVHSIKGGSGKSTNFRVLCYLSASLYQGRRLISLFVSFNVPLV